MLRFDDVYADEEVRSLLRATTLQMEVLGYTEHAFRHCKLVADRCGQVLEELGADQRMIELARISGYLHDIGNALARNDHAQYGAMMAYNLLRRMSLPVDEAVIVMMAIANHDEGIGKPVSAPSAALILGDKTDVHRSRVTNRDLANFDIHDRVNYAVTRSALTVDAAARTATLSLEIDTEISAMMEYFEIFLTRMKMCQNAAAYLGLSFRLVINGTRLL